MELQNFLAAGSSIWTLNWVLVFYYNPKPRPAAPWSQQTKLLGYTALFSNCRLWWAQLLSFLHCLTEQIFQIILHLHLVSPQLE